MDNKRVITPIHFIDENNTKNEMIKEEEPELNFKCKYGSINVKLSKIPILKHFI